MAKLVDALVSGSNAERCAGSSPVPGTNYKLSKNNNLEKNIYNFSTNINH